MSDESKAEAAQADLETEQLDTVSGGFNPQPDPPGHSLADYQGGGAGAGKLEK